MRKHEPTPLLQETERGMYAMDENQADATAMRVKIHLHKGNIDMARAALEDAWASHIAEKEPVTLDDCLVKVCSDTRLINILDKHRIMTVRDLFDVSDKVVQGFPSAGWDAVRKVRALRFELRKRLGEVEEDGEE